mmetsp:Transcript_84189/g.140601  ORF Transcript_84189/g.140601 Transcript_84189/m.140601 type:complete len:116 (-) Transcript_84189:518-865(-)|eukprot:CAMPEP_0174291610 /NCGR_PEP_ID=MMETSP0809-20121228/32639_1 /TAXON_ID=73025 ORGANISM="Eutreptiella gymnastica-like, Strain CCMP1594" /NCGR_SAMPLE_ID=MMETSP0809 /ASSEMBLY_ACC=CAM_ASM_000658 /LENGTH=115 /DNA_ID=CAMNT_0015391053 /DNA_START=65 /DNA_END=412 /DNA_ORIENTATION=-
MEGHFRVHMERSIDTRPRRITAEAPTTCSKPCPKILVLQAGSFHSCTGQGTGRVHAVAAPVVMVGSNGRLATAPPPPQQRRVLGTHCIICTGAGEDMIDNSKEMPEAHRQPWDAQ